MRTTSTYKIRKNGKTVTQEMLDRFESHNNYSEEEIAMELGISRKGLWKIRKKMGWPQRQRSDKGGTHYSNKR